MEFKRTALVKDKRPRPILRCSRQHAIPNGRPFALSLCHRCPSLPGSTAYSFSVAIKSHDETRARCLHKRTSRFTSFKFCYKLIASQPASPFCTTSRITVSARDPSLVNPDPTSLDATRPTLELIAAAGLWSFLFVSRRSAADFIS